MKAAILTRYDKNTTDLEVRDIPIPTPSADEVLVRIHTAAVNPLDNMIMRGEVKMIIPYALPFAMGNEFSGIVEGVGASVRAFEVGDRVYGRMPLSKIGAFAEYAAVDAGALAHVPDYLSLEEAVAVPLTALTAMQAFELMNAKPGQTVFISGGTGSLGAMAIPVAKSLGLTVATNGNGMNEERVRALGADVFIDYKKQNYTDVLADVDLVLDTLGDRELPSEFTVLKEGGRLVSLRGMPNGRFARRMGMPWHKRMLLSFAGRKYDAMAARKHQTYDFVFVHEDGAQMAHITSLFPADRPLTASIDSTFTLDQINKAMAKVRAGGSQGKTIVRIGDFQ